METCNHREGDNSQIALDNIFDGLAHSDSSDNPEDVYGDGIDPNEGKNRKDSNTMFALAVKKKIKDKGVRIKNSRQTDVLKEQLNLHSASSFPTEITSHITDIKNEEGDDKKLIRDITEGNFHKDEILSGKVLDSEQISRNVIQNELLNNQDGQIKNPKTFSPGFKEHQNQGGSRTLANQSFNESWLNLLNESQDFNRVQNQDNSYDVSFRVPINEIDQIRRQNLTNQLNNIQRDSSEDQNIIMQPSPEIFQNNFQELPPPQLHEQMSEEAKMEEFDKILSLHAKFKLRRALMLIFTFLGISLNIFIAILQETHVSLRWIFVSLYLFLIYYILENLHRLVFDTMIPWKKIENAFMLWDVTTLAIFVFTLDLYFHGLEFKTKYISLIPGFNVIWYVAKSNCPKTHKQYQITVRTLCFVQIFLAAEKLDGDLDWPWKLILIICWIFLGLIGLYFIVIAATFVVIVSMRCFGIVFYQNTSMATQFIGFLWQTLLSGLVTSVFLALIFFVSDFDAKKPSNKMLIKGLMLYIQILSLLLAFYTFICYRWIIQFLIKFTVDETDYRENLGIKNEEEVTPPILKERRVVYLVKLSSTYFLSLQKSFSHLSKENFKSFKKNIQKIRNSRFKKGSVKIMKDQNSVNQKPIAIEHLKNEKQKLDQVFGKKTLKQNFVKITKDAKKKQEKLIPSSSMLVINTTNFCSMVERQDSHNSYNEPNNSGNICLSEGGRPQTEILGRSLKKENEEVQCYICFDKPPNAIIAECGHGGVCVDCAIETIKMRGQCMECRRDARKVLRIETKTKFKDIVKGYETITIVPEVEKPEI